jgi:hypothetical protein
MSVRHQPGHTELTARPFSLRAAANRQVMPLSAVLETEYAGLQVPISLSWPAPLDTLTIRPAELLSRCGHERLRDAQRTQSICLDGAFDHFGRDR